MIIESRAPNRVDLSGGSLDIFPAYILLGLSIVINVSIDIYSHCILEKIEENVWEVNLKDLGKFFKVSDIESLNNNNDTKLIYEAIKFFNLENYKGLRITTYNEAPLKSGLGASSALLIAIVKNLLKTNRILYSSFNDYDIVDFASFIEAKVLHTLTGKQDYVSAIWGGINAIFFDKNQFVIEKLNSDKLIEELEKYVVLAYSGFEHQSGNLNWLVMKSLLDKDIYTIEKLKKIQEISEDIYEIISIADIEKIGHLVKQEWNVRKTLSPEHTNRYIEEFCAQLDKYSWGYKLCGAAGGGTILIFTNNHSKVREIINDFNFKEIKFQIDNFGLFTKINEF
jgi:D-glycero-alpha-D-manno-heptose-7-phosphate kinase